MIDSLIYDKNRHLYYLNSDNLDVFDDDFKNIYTIEKVNMIGTDDNCNPIVVIWNSYFTYKEYMITPVEYEEIIELADEYLGDFEPDNRVKAKYNLE